MSFNSDIINNTVSAENQVNDFVKMVCPFDSGLKVLFLGNSITRHAVKPELGWTRDCGMAASNPEMDYVHLVAKFLTEKHGKLNYCVTNVGRFELRYKTVWNCDEYTIAKQFEPDVVIIRLGENVNVKEFDGDIFREKFVEFIDYFKAKNSKVVITDLFWDYPPLGEIIKSVCDEYGYTFVTIADLGYKDENKAITEYEHKGVGLHPNDLGMKRIADRIIEKL